MSQVTKPMALDETLQDVVTAIQGITQGGMIVSSGNVGSSTQPVYINGGVPTASDMDKPYYVMRTPKGRIFQYRIPSTTAAGWYTLLTFHTNNTIIMEFEDGLNQASRGHLHISSQFLGTTVPALTWFGQIWSAGRYPKFRITRKTSSGLNDDLALDIYYSGDSDASVGVSVLYSEDTLYELKTALTSAVYTNEVCVLNRVSGDTISTTGNIRQPIVTGTPTIIATSSLAFRSGVSSYVKKAGNVVNFMIQVSVSADVAVNTDLIQLPYSPVEISQGLMTQQGVPYEAVITTTGRIQTPWQKVLASKTNATLSGTYLTND